jgi:hypothetical protein
LLRRLAQKERVIYVVRNQAIQSEERVEESTGTHAAGGALESLAINNRKDT